MEESLAALGRFGTIWNGFRKAGEKVARRKRRIDQNSLRRSGMRVTASECDSCGACRPRFVSDVAKFLSIDRVCELRSPLLDLELVHRPANFFIWRKRDRDVAVFDLRIQFENLDHRHHFGDARLVIGAKQRRAVRSDDVVTDQILEIGVLRNGNNLCLVIRQNNVAALVILVNNDVDIRPGNRRRRVHVSNESDSRHFRIVRQIPHNHSINNSLLADANILHAEVLQLFFQQSRQHKLLFSTRKLPGVLSRLRVDLDVTQESRHRRFGRWFDLCRNGRKQN